MAEQKPFRELIRPGTNFEFVGKRRLWVGLSLAAILATIVVLFANKAVRGDYLNWNIDFKGGTEMIFSFGGEKVPPAKVRSALTEGGFGDFDVSEMSWSVTQPDGSEKAQSGFMVRTVDFGAVPLAERVKFAAAFSDKFEKSHEIVSKVGWSGDTMFVRSKKPFTEAETAAFFKSVGLEMKPWGELAAQFAHPQEGTGEYNYQLAVYGIDRQYQNALEKGIGGGVKVHVEQVYAVGAKAGAQLRNDGIKALFYSMLLIMLYLAFRFDVRYAPGATIALLHDAFLVVGVFAATWTDFSLTTVAAILTIIGYSVNDTVIIFDRIRENAEKLKDKKLTRIVNISLNETLSRSLLTACTVFATTLMMNIFGTGAVRNFAFAMNIGVVVGAYSSIFIASPVFLWIHYRWYGGEEGTTPRRSGRVAAKPAEPDPDELADAAEPDEDEGEGAKA